MRVSELVGVALSLVNDSQSGTPADDRGIVEDAHVQVIKVKSLYLEIRAALKVVDPLLFVANFRAAANLD